MPPFKHLFPCHCVRFIGCSSQTITGFPHVLLSWQCSQKSQMLVLVVILRNSCQDAKQTKHKIISLSAPFLSFPVQWWLGRQVWCDWWLPEGSSWWNHHKTKVSICDLVWWLLLEPEAWCQPEEPLVPWILAAPLPVQVEGTPAGEQHLQPNMHLLVQHRFYVRHLFVHFPLVI